MVKSGYRDYRSAEVVVVGAGPAGIAAAVAAARAGRDTWLVEAKDRIGGVMTDCPGMMLGAGYPCGHSIGGFFQELVDRLAAMEPPAAALRRCGLANFGDEVVYDHEALLLALDTLLDGAGVHVVLGHLPVALHMQDEGIAAVELAGAQSSLVLRGDIFIDCTGDGDLAAKAGVPYELGDRAGRTMGATLTFFMENVDWDAAFADEADPYFTSFAAKGIREGRLHESIPQIYMLKGLRKGSVFFNTVTVAGVNGLSEASVRTATATARRRVHELARFCVEELPGFGEAWLSRVGPQVGVRETRRLAGLHRLTYPEIAAATKFEDGVVACDNPLDEVMRDEEARYYSHEAALPKGDYYTIPFRCLVPRSVPNLLFAGRNVSVDLRSFASIRGMPQCMGMGQAAGLASDLALARGVPVQALDHRELVPRLLGAGVAGIGGRPLAV